MTFVPRAVRRFSADHPDVGLSLSELAVDAQVEGLRSGLLDIGILRLPAATDGLELASLADEGLVVVMAESHPLAQRKQISARALAGEPLILLARQMVPGLYDQIIALQHQHGGAHIAQEATSIQAVLGLVAAGLGISLLPGVGHDLGPDRRQLRRPDRIAALSDADRLARIRSLPSDGRLPRGGANACGVTSASSPVRRLGYVLLSGPAGSCR